MTTTYDLMDLTDEYGQLRGNGPALVGALAAVLPFKPVLMSWCDNYDTRLTVLMAIPARVGSVAGFAPADTVLHVSVEGYGNYGFAIKNEGLHPDYIAEKLGRRAQTNPTWVELAKLVSGVRIALSEQL